MQVLLRSGQKDNLGFVSVFFVCVSLFGKNRYSVVLYVESDIVWPEV